MIYKRKEKTMKLSISNVVGHMPAGNYKGVITKQYVSPDENHLWLNIEVEGKKDLLNICLSLNSIVFNTFAKDFADENGEFDTVDFVNTEITFSLIDRKINGNVYSKIAYIKAEMEEI